MKHRLMLFLPLLGFLLLSGLLYRGLSMEPAGRESAMIGQPFPAFELATLADPGQQVDASLLQGQVTLVNVWGEWCPTCKQEMPQLQALAQEGVHLVGIDYKDKREKGRAFLAQYGNPFTLNIFDPEGRLGFDLGVYGAPETFLVDADGVIRYHHTGYIAPHEVTEVILPEVARWRE
ncbi:DsbE family thiol:disulfide interchange protein [Halomonas almeriensis]|uniref:DsbE family thiol:disulfide interchange protein n=1 Tax=Halomonas almeriensis TaxID=308163 RepID=UPI0025B38CBB|nr:DsbE family thiol:disulfide interchange protein [Halomonas almeriensis]MDN3553390.1 DsbE family thiol:disulfide interchange protein [Halomonas almeriensis]